MEDVTLSPRGTIKLEMDYEGTMYFVSTGKKPGQEGAKYLQFPTWERIKVFWEHYCSGAQIEFIGTFGLDAITTGFYVKVSGPTSPGQRAAFCSAVLAECQVAMVTLEPMQPVNEKPKTRHLAVVGTSKEG